MTQYNHIQRPQDMCETTIITSRSRRQVEQHTQLSRSLEKRWEPFCWLLSVICYYLRHLGDAPAYHTDQPKCQGSTVLLAAQAVLQVGSGPFCAVPRRGAGWRRCSTEDTHLCSRPEAQIAEKGGTVSKCFVKLIFTTLCRAHFFPTTFLLQTPRKKLPDCFVF